MRFKNVVAFENVLPFKPCCHSRLRYVTSPARTNLDFKIPAAKTRCLCGYRENIPQFTISLSHCIVNGLNMVSTGFFRFSSGFFQIDAKRPGIDPFFGLQATCFTCSCGRSDEKIVLRSLDDALFNPSIEEGDHWCCELEATCNLSHQSRCR